jgi:hypothetical protein
MASNGNLAPFGLSLSKPFTSAGTEQGEGFDKLSPNGGLLRPASSPYPSLTLPLSTRISRSHAARVVAR